MNTPKSGHLIFLFLLLISACAEPGKIDRKALVTRHNPKISAMDSLDVLSVGNGNFAFTVDATGLQTFPEYYEKGIPLGTQANWAWHSFPNTADYHLDQVSRPFASCQDSIPYVYRYVEGKKEAASEYLRQNPHRLHMGIIGYQIEKANGEIISVQDLKSIDFQLDMWAGEIKSTFYVENQPVTTKLYAHQQQDQITVQVNSPLINEGRLKVKFHFPYGTGSHRSAGYDFNQPELHTTELRPEKNQALFIRRLDSTQLYVNATWEQPATISNPQKHEYWLTPDPDHETFHFTVSFSAKKKTLNHSFAVTWANNAVSWQKFWTSGGAIDFSGSTDPRAHELERRVILSQYLTKIQSSGSLPPQETGLTYNSWYGKFHLEMHWWHGVHFILWNRPQLFANSMGYYHDILAKAKATAQWQGFNGARWPKMTDPYGNESPSNVGTFLVWQQPHPIYYAELFYRDTPTDSVLNYFKDIVFETADFMASFPTYNDSLDQYDLCHPLIPAQEVFNKNNTDNPAFELAYWHYALGIAQQWRQRLGMQPDLRWQEVLDKLAPLPVSEGLYLPHKNQPDSYTDEQYRVDHPIVLGTFGLLPGSERLDTAIMRNTFAKVMRQWNWQRTWGWDYPMIAMAAARLGEPEKAVDALLMEVQKNTYLKNGHNYQGGGLTIYLPGNGGLLTAVAMMAGGWDGSLGESPGFPRDGGWELRCENLKQMP